MSFPPYGQTSVPMHVDIIDTRPLVHRVLGTNAINSMFGRHPIYDNIFSRLSPQQLVWMSAVNIVIRNSVQDFSSRAYSVDRRLSRFFNDPCSFRSLMARTQMVISGSFALQLFDRTYYLDSDLDLYVHPNRSITEVGLWLESAGYEYIPAEWQRGIYADEAERILADIDLLPGEAEDADEASLLYSMKSLRAVYSFEGYHSNSGTRRIQIIVARISPISSILDFHSTCVMNIITYNAAYSLYPYATFARREAVIVNEDMGHAEEALAKYSTRGWRLLAKSSPLLRLLAQPDSPFYAPWWAIGKRRWVCDSRSWVIHFNMAGVIDPPPLSLSSPHPGWDPVAECGWKLMLNDDGFTRKLDIKHVPIKTTIFRWRYTAPDEEYLRSIIPFFYSQGRLEHKKVTTGETRDSVSDMWTWWDYMLPMLRLQYGNVFLRPRSRIG